jgi:hypothetical protein
MRSHKQAIACYACKHAYITRIGARGCHCGRIGVVFMDDSTNLVDVVADVNRMFSGGDPPSVFDWAERVRAAASEALHRRRSAQSKLRGPG